MQHSMPRQRVAFLHFAAANMFHVCVLAPLSGGAGITEWLLIRGVDSY